MKIVMYAILLWVFISFTGCKFQSQHDTEKAKVVQTATNFCSCVKAKVKSLEYKRNEYIPDYAVVVCTNGLRSIIDSDFEFYCEGK